MIQDYVSPQKVNVWCILISKSTYYEAKERYIILESNLTPLMRELLSKNAGFTVKDLLIITKKKNLIDLMNSLSAEKVSDKFTPEQTNKWFITSTIRYIL